MKAAAWPESLSQDLRFGVRMLRKNPLVTTAALLSLSLAIGSCAAVFSLVDALVVRQREGFKPKLSLNTHKRSFPMSP